MFKSIKTLEGDRGMDRHNYDPFQRYFNKVHTRNILSSKRN